MWQPYRQVIQVKLPRAKIVADRFHVMKQFSERLNQMRRSIQRQADELVQEHLEGCRWLLVKNRNEQRLRKKASCNGS